MFRALWTAASGMYAQQANIDNISNNLANVNTTGYKKTTVEFQDLLYANLRKPGAVSSAGGTLPIGLQMGTGVRVAGTRMDFTNGNLQQTNNPLDLAITSDAFFEIIMPDGTSAYTKDGSFKVNSNGELVTVDGYKVAIQSNTGDPITVEDLSNLAITNSGGIVMPSVLSTGPEMYVLAEGAELVENPPGFFTGEFEDADPENPPVQGRYFKVELPDGTEAYTNANAFRLDDEGNIVTIATAPDAEGNLLPAKLSVSEMPDFGADVVQIAVNDDGKFVVLQEAGRINMVSFTNPQGLEKKGQNLFVVSAASGAPQSVGSDEDNLLSGFVEASNVQVAEEMVKMIVAQRAYELNSKAITTSDEMLGIANNLKR